MWNKKTVVIATKESIFGKKIETACKPETSWKGTSTSGGNYGKDEGMFDAQQMMFSLDVYLCQI